jgi:hypothetical protein
MEQKMKRATTRRLLGCETLEHRQLLAGLVQATIENGQLIVRGDSAGNQVLIHRGASTGEVVISGGRLTAGAETQVNGSLAPVTLSGFTGGINIEILGGDDHVAISDLEINGSVVANLGAGNDELLLTGVQRFIMDNPDEHFFLNNGDGFGSLIDAVTIHGRVDLRGESGNDYSHVVAATVDGDLSIISDAGDDGVNVEGDGGINMTPRRTVVGGSIVVIQGDGNDSAGIDMVDVGGHLNVLDMSANFISPTVGASCYVSITNANVTLDIAIFGTIHRDHVTVGDFQARDVFIHTGDFNDRAYVYRGSAHNVSLWTGSGHEGGAGFFEVSLGDLDLSGDLMLDTGDGFDNAQIKNVDAQSLQVFMRGGSDGLIVEDCDIADALFDMGSDGDVMGMYAIHADALLVLLGSGDDQLWFGGVSSSLAGTVSGDAEFGNHVYGRGGSIDRIRPVGTNPNLSRQYEGFEFIWNDDFNRYNQIVEE